MIESSTGRSSLGSGIGHIASPAAAAASRTRVRKSSSLPMTAAVLPRATTWAPVSVATSTIASGEVSLARAMHVTQHHPTLGIGVEDLDRLAAAHRHDVARALGRGARHVLGEAQVAGHRHGQAELGDGEDGAGDRGRPGHVALHRQHAAAGLMHRPPESKVMPLPTRAIVAFGRAGE